MNGLSPAARDALSRGLGLVSNKNVSSGIPNSEGVTDATHNNFIPAAGSLSNLPSSIKNELTRTDRVVTTDAHSVGGQYVPQVTTLNGVGAMQDIAEIFRPANETGIPLQGPTTDPRGLQSSAGYAMNGSEAGQAMLAATSQYANADIAQREAMAGDSFLGRPYEPQIFGDQHGGTTNPYDSGVTSALADVVSVAGHDHVGMHDLATGAGKDDFLHGFLHENWGDQSGKVGTAFNWMDDNPHNPLNGETASSVGHYVAEHSHEFDNLPGGGNFGQDNPALAQAVAEGVSPYLKDFAGYRDDGSGVSPNGVTPFTAEGNDNHGGVVGMADLFAVLDQNHDAALTVNGAAAAQYQDILAGIGRDGGDPTDLKIAGRLGNAMNDGAEMSHLQQHEQDLWDSIKGDPDKAKDWVKSVGGILAKVPGPVGWAGWGAAQVAGLPSLDDVPAGFNGGTIMDNILQGGGGITNTTDRQAAFLEGLLVAYPSIANDRNIAPLLTDDGTVDWNVIRDGRSDARRMLSQFFSTNDPRTLGAAFSQFGINDPGWESTLNTEGADPDWSH